MGVIADASVPDAEIDAFVEEFQATFVPEEEAAGPAPETVEVEGRRIQYLKMGEGGTPLIFIPASPETSTSSSSTRRLCPQTAPSTPLTCPAMAAPRRTWERATWTSSPGLWRDFWTRWASRRRLAGHSIGGAIAGTFALAHPERVASLILIASAGLGEEINADYIEGFIAANRRREMKNVLQLLFADPDLVTRDLVNDVLAYKRLDGVDEASAPWPTGVPRTQAGEGAGPLRVRRSHTRRLGQRG